MELENLINPNSPGERTKKLAACSPYLGGLRGLQTLESSAKEAPQPLPDTELEGAGQLTLKGDGENLSHMTPGFLIRSFSARWAQVEGLFPNPKGGGLGEPLKWAAHRLSFGSTRAGLGCPCCLP